MFSMICSRTDLAYVISLVSRFTDPGREHWNAVKWILRYLNGSIDYGIIYGSSTTNNVQVEGFVDSD